MTNNIINLVIHLLSAYGLYLINKKNGEEYSWIAFIPLINIVSYLQAAGKSLVWIWYFVLILIAILAGTFGMMILGPVSSIISLIGMLAGLIMGLMIIDGISKKAGYGFGMALGLLFLPFIFLPYIGTNMPEGGVSNKATKTTIDL